MLALIWSGFRIAFGFHMRAGHPTPACDDFTTIVVSRGRANPAELRVGVAFYIARHPLIHQRISLGDEVMDRCRSDSRTS